MHQNSAIFLDRDGVLIEEVGLITEPLKMIPCNKVFDALEILRRIGFKLFVVTNQPVVARGLIREEELVQLHDHLARLCVEALGVNPIKKFYFCPHHPDAQVESYRIHCECRKPKPGMLHQAQAEFGLNLKSSYMVGDRISDMAAGHAASCKNVLIESGAHLEKPIISSVDYDPATIPITHRYNSLWDFANSLKP